MEKMNFEALASKYGLMVDFVKELHDKVVDKENFVRAVRMFANGTLPYDVATGKEPINVAELRHQVAKNMWDFRKNKASKMQEAMEQHRKIVEYYNGCTSLTYRHKPNKAVKDIVFIKDGHLVAFAHFEPKQGGIYAANNEVMPDFRWNPHECLARLRKLNKAFYRQVKKAAFNSPKEWFDFNIKP